MTGGGLVRSLGGWGKIKEMRSKGQERIKGDQRILGDMDFVSAVLSQAEEKYSHQQELANQGYNFERVVERVAFLYSVKPDDVLKRGRQKQRAAARSLVCFWAVRELGLSLKEVSERLGISSPGVSYCVQKGEKIAAENSLHLLG